MTIQWGKKIIFQLNDSAVSGYPYRKKQRKKKQMTPWLRSGFNNRIPQTGWLMSNRNSSLTVLEAGCSKSGCQWGQVWWGIASCLQTASFSFYLHMLGREKEGSLSVLIPFLRVF